MFFFFSHSPLVLSPVRARPLRLLNRFQWFLLAWCFPLFAPVFPCPPLQFCVFGFGFTFPTLAERDFFLPPHEQFFFSFG